MTAVVDRSGTHVAGADEALVIAVKRAAEARDHAGEREHQRLEELHAVAEEGQPLLVLAHAGEHEAELRLLQEPRAGID